MSRIWTGVMPAITTPFHEDLSIDHEFLARHASWMIDNGCTGIIVSGSLGEGATLSFDEKVSLVRTVAEAVGTRAPVTLGVASLSTSEAVALAKAGADAGANGLMVLPPYVYRSDWREIKAHVVSVLAATHLPCLLYNNPPAYGTDFLAHHIAELMDEYPNLTGVKDSSGDARRVTGNLEATNDAVQMMVGGDDVAVEGAMAGASGWVAGLVNAFPAESVQLFTRAQAHDPSVTALYRWFLPLLRMDMVPKFVQLIKLCQALVGMGNERVRGPRLALVGDERASAIAIIDKALADISR